jgi:cation diffusion facilitator family transporter
MSGPGHGHQHRHPPVVSDAGVPCPYLPGDLDLGGGNPALRLRAADVRKVFWITLVLNFVVAVAKGIYSIKSGSVTLGADAFHSVLDGSANVLALVGMHLGSAPASASHPYGRRKIELLAALGIGVLITVSLLEVATAAFQSLRAHRPPPDIGWAGFAVVVGSMLVNYFVARYEGARGAALKSPLLEADAHHTRADLYASGTVLLSFLGARQGLWWADGVGGLVVVLMVGHVAWEVFRENVPSLLDAAVLDPAHVRDIGAGISGIEGIHRVRSRGTKWAIELDLHVQVAADMKVEDAHALANRLEVELRARVPELSDVVVHLEPGAQNGPQTLR